MITYNRKGHFQKSPETEIDIKIEIRRSAAISVNGESVTRLRKYTDDILWFEMSKGDDYMVPDDSSEQTSNATIFGLCQRD